MTTATVAAPTGNQFGIILAIFLVITFTTCVVLWVHEHRWDRHDDKIAAHAEQLATLYGRVQALADFLEVDINDAQDDSPEALAGDEPTEEFPALPETVPDGMPLAVQTALIEARPNGADWVEQELEVMRARNAERMARRVEIGKEAS